MESRGTTSLNKMKLPTAIPLCSRSFSVLLECNVVYVHVCENHTGNMPLISVETRDRKWSIARDLESGKLEEISVLVFDSRTPVV